MSDNTLRKEKLIMKSKRPLLVRFAINFMLKLEGQKRLQPFGHVRLDTAMNRGVALDKIVQTVDKVTEESLHDVIGTDYDTLADKSLQQQLKIAL